MSVLKYKNGLTWEAISSLPSSKSGLADPTTSTVANYVGQIYVNLTAKTIFVCTAINAGVYTWGTVTSKPSKVSYTLAATGWDADKQYNGIETLYSHTIYDVQMELANTATTEQYKAYGKAGITGNTTTNVLTALGTVPTIDIPVILTLEVK